MTFASGLGKTMAGSILYSNTAATPERMNGIAPRLASISATANVLNAGGTGSDLTSIYVVTWGAMTAHMLYPKHGVAGFQHDDMGIQMVTDAAGGEYQAYVDYFSWKAGLAVKDPKAIGRIANVETAGTTNIFNEDDLITLINRMNTGAGTAIYVNPTLKTQMEIRLKDKTNVHFTQAEGLAPGPVLKFKGYPVRTVEQILNTESALT